MRTFNEWIYDKGAIFGEPLPAARRLSTAPDDPDEASGGGFTKNPDGTATVYKEYPGGRRKERVVPLAALKNLNAILAEL